MPKKPINERNRYWAFAADPDRYRIFDAASNLETDWWTTQGRAVRLGDRAVIWQLRDRQGRRGIVALAEIVAGPEVRSDAGNPYWVDAAHGREAKERVGVRYLRLPEPMWIDGPHHDLVASLSVSRAHGGTVFNVTTDEWHSIQLAAQPRIEDDVADIEKRFNLSPTQKEALILARRGKGPSDVAC
jgi:EVE domain-containing protein